jgi:hypothetical protein
VDFRWIEWNLEHIGKHGVRPHEAEGVVENATRPFPMQPEKGKYLAWGRGDGGRFLQVIYLLDNDGTAFVIHSRELTDREKRRYRRMRQK